MSSSAQAVTRPAAKMRSILARRSITHPASVFDPLSIRSAQDAGFESAMLAGSVASLAILGAPDVVAITLTELADLCRRICRASDLPLIVDADHGFGDAFSAARTVQELEAAGVAALTIEDTLLPTRFAGAGGELISIDEAAGKIRNAVAARRDADLVVIGRTTLTLAPLSDIAERVKAYAAAGADAIFLSGPKTREQIQAVSKASPLPVVLGRITPELRDDAFLLDHNVRIVLQGHTPCMAAIHAVQQAMTALRAGEPVKEVANAALLARLTRQDRYELVARETMRKTLD
ncbi:oxaloacetate decarboxylase [Hydrogenophaga sp.]|uniref:isocitrate lyase/PEP mutase family protein n=1 Tax=Hydrogenophaga sp. TaxID=1904254 RepID=UPI0027198ABE|nr:isocitrate lyase/phosphoenolpyruvate mutase family protein [Hydrogenophaga sp.]MDO9436905.1 isocitrate lyase/phosphoenolpyruvate mutase family protein [Hydrogenophaga sp.]